MSAVLIDVTRLAPASKRLEKDIAIGKDILDLLAGAMYIDPLNVFREYVQNAADSIDSARDADASIKPRIDITFDHSERSIKIRDNGQSIAPDAFVSRLVTFGASGKRGTKQRGFRGVGRLAGLGFCQQLFFRGRTSKDAKVQEVEWDGRILKRLVRDPDFTGGLKELVKEVVVTRDLPTGQYPDRFFEVELRKVLRLKNDVLLNEDAVRHYLAQVGPVPMHPKFPFKAQVTELFEKHGIPAPISIHVGVDPIPVHRLLGESVPAANGHETKLLGFDAFEISSMDMDAPSAVGWIVDHAYTGAISKPMGIGGVRLMAGNVQVGESDLVADLFPEARFGAWTIGEIHVLSPRILPNGRRDNFEPSGHYAHLQDHISVRAKAIGQKIRDQSIARNRVRAVRLELSKADELVEEALRPGLPRMLLVAIQGMARERLMRAETEMGKVTLSSEATSLRGRAAELTSMVDGLSGRGARKSAAKTSRMGLEEPIVAALKTILQGAASPKEGVTIAASVLKAFEDALA